MNEDCVAFHDIVTLLGWRDSSSRGPVVTIGLSSRSSLEHFDTATRRRGRRAGQRYHAAVNESLEDPKTHALPPPTILDLWFAGANWAHQDGARVVFTVDQDGLELFKAMTTKDSNHGTPSVFWLTLVQVDDDETPVNQRKADNIERVTVLHGEPMVQTGLAVIPDAAEIAPNDWADVRVNGGFVEPEKPKGGPLSKRVAMLCQDDEFQWFVSEKEDRDEKSSFEQADAYVKRVCGITSKVEFDLNPDAWRKLVQEIHRPFLAWGGGAA